MKTDKLMDALNYIDDDLINACDEVRVSVDSSKGSVKKTRKMSRARVTAIWGSVAAAALVLVVGFAVIKLSNDASNESNRKHHKNHSVSKSEDSDEAMVEGEEIKDVQLPLTTSADAPAQEEFNANTGVQAEIKEEVDSALPADTFAQEYTNGVASTSDARTVFFDVADAPELVDLLISCTNNKVENLGGELPIVCTVSFHDDDFNYIRFEICSGGANYYMIYCDAENNRTTYSITEAQASSVESLIAELG